MHMQKSRFAKGLLAPAATMLRGAMSRPAENYFDPAAPGPSPHAARSERFACTCYLKFLFVFVLPLMMQTTVKKTMPDQL